MVVALVLVHAIAPLRNFFELILLTPVDYLLLAGAALLWAVLVWFSYRWQLFKHFFTIT